ncbi:hypothetical protein IJ579_05285 [bacterium]|nr:hypothetical protein [bacterium]
MKRILAFLLLILFFAPPVLAKPGTIVTYTIDPEKNAYIHNNKGIEYASEKLYYAAIQEFKIAISLNPKKQSTAVYFNNLGKVYMTIGYPQFALDCFENALTQYSLNFEYYENLAECYKQLGIASDKIELYKQKNGPLNKIMVALLEEKLGNEKRAIVLLDEFSIAEPDLIITPAVKEHVKGLVGNL